MKNNLSIALNIVLLIAVGVLFYLQFSGEKNTSGKTKVLAPSEIKSSKIVFVNIDTLNLKYDFFKDAMASARVKQQSLENQYQAQAKEFQNAYVELQQNLQKGLLTEAEAKTEEQLLMRKKDRMDAVEVQLQQLAENMQVQNARATNDVKKYIAEYNKKSNYTYVLMYTDQAPFILHADSTLDITNDIVEGLNLQYNAEKEAAKKK